MKRNLLINPGGLGTEEFREAAKRAGELGVTHMVIEGLPKSLWMWSDRRDPYPNWSMSHSQLFKLVCPPQLRQWLPVAFIEECMAFVKERCGILEALGMRGALLGNEPFWLPEEAFRAHPSWRGARCDHPRRAAKAYYSPCIDNEEVLSMYRYAMKVLCQETGINFFSFKSNDCGGGLCWSSGTYTGPNGPEACRHRSMSDRICGFLDALSEGARQGGVEAFIHFNADLEFKEPEHQVNMSWPRLKANQAVNHRDLSGKDPVMEAPSLRKVFLKGIPDVFHLSGMLEKAQNEDKAYVMLNLPVTDFSELWAYTERAIKNKPGGPVERLLTMRETAMELMGSSMEKKEQEVCADFLVELWQCLNEGKEHLSHTGLDLIQYGCFNQRWLNRPFVLFPSELTEEERSYYRPFQFQAMDEEHALDLLNMQGIECARGFSAMFLITQTCLKAIKAFLTALEKLKVLKEKNIGSTNAEKLKKLENRVKIQVCLIKNIMHAVKFQELADRILSSPPPVEGLRWPTRNDARYEDFQQITRAEMDNCYELAALLEEYPGEAIASVEPEHEDCFTFSRLLPQQLREKVGIMLSHELDANRVLERHNI